MLTVQEEEEKIINYKLCKKFHFTSLSHILVLQFREYLFHITWSILRLITGDIIAPNWFNLIQNTIQLNISCGWRHHFLLSFIRLIHELVVSVMEVISVEMYFILENGTDLSWNYKWAQKINLQSNVGVRWWWSNVLYVPINAKT